MNLIRSRASMPRNNHQEYNDVSINFDMYENDNQNSIANISRINSGDIQKVRGNQTTSNSFINPKKMTTEQKARSFMNGNNNKKM